MSTESTQPDLEPEDDDQEEVVTISARRKRRKVKVEISEGVFQTFYITAMSGLVGEQYLDREAKNVRLSRDGVNTGLLKNYSGHFAYLLGKTMTYEENDKPVPERLIRSWPIETQLSLYEIASDVCGLNKRKAEEEAKNS